MSHSLWALKLVKLIKFFYINICCSVFVEKLYQIWLHYLILRRRYDQNNLIQYGRHRHVKFTSGLHFDTFLRAPNSDGVTPCGGAKYSWGIKFAWFSTNKSLYLANDTRYRHGCYGRRIGNNTQAFEWHQFQWPWETSKSVFKVTILFNVK